MKKIFVEATLHKGQRRIKLKFRYDDALITLIKKIPHSKWSATMKCWHIPYNDNSFHTLEKLSPDDDINLVGLDKLIEDRKYHFFEKKLSEEMEQTVISLQRWMVSQRYSHKTVSGYIHSIRTFLAFLKDRKPEEISNEDVVKFNYDYIIRNKLSPSYQNQMISAIKLFFKVHLKAGVYMDTLQRPRRSRSLPGIFSKEEVENLLRSLVNVKHKTILALIYACGLRRGELISLRITSVDFDRRLLFIKEAKGMKDRVVPLPEGMIAMIRNYLVMYKPKYWLFEGWNRGKPYSETSLQRIFERAVHRAGIKKPLTLHCLRHSYATHLLENGVDLRYIQELLGHKSSRTTEIYTHVTQRSIESIKSPFENLNI